MYTYFLNNIELKDCYNFAFSKRPWWKKSSKNEKCDLFIGLGSNFDGKTLHSFFKQSYLLTNKSSLYKSLRESGECIFLPKTYCIEKTKDIMDFINNYDITTEKIWICKPSGESCGKDIKIFSVKKDTLSENLKDIIDYTYKNFMDIDFYMNGFIIQEYIMNPLLIHDGKKFDIRQLVLVDDEFNIYRCKYPYIRVASKKFTLDDDDKYIHLNNFCIQKESGKQINFSLDSIVDQIPFIENDMTNIILTSLNSAKSKLDTHMSYHIFGYDFLVDNNHKVWLLEINFGPTMKGQYLEDISNILIDDMFSIVIDKIYPHDKINTSFNSNSWIKITP